MGVVEVVVGRRLLSEGGRGPAAVWVCVYVCVRLGWENIERPGTPHAKVDHFDTQRTSRCDSVPLCAKGLLGTAREVPGPLESLVSQSGTIPRSE